MYPADPADPIVPEPLRPASFTAAARASSSPTVVSSTSENEVCCPDLLHAVSPWRTSTSSPTSSPEVSFMRGVVACGRRDLRHPRRHPRAAATSESLGSSGQPG